MPYPEKAEEDVQIEKIILPKNAILWIGRFPAEFPLERRAEKTLIGIPGQALIDITFKKPTECAGEYLTPTSPLPHFSLTLTLLAPCSHLTLTICDIPKRQESG